MTRRNVNIGVWLTCENPNCPLSDKAFLVNYYLRDKRRYCSKSCASKKNWQTNPEYRDKISECTKKQWENSDFREKMKEVGRKAMRQNWDNSDFRDRMSITCSEAIKKYWEDPSFRSMMSEKMKKQLQDPQFRAKATEANRTPEARKRASDKTKEQWQDESYRSMMSEMFTEVLKILWNDPDFRLRMSERAKDHWSDSEFVEKMSKISSETMKSSIKNGAFGKAQKLLYEELTSRVSGVFGWERPVVLDHSIREKYNCKDKYYLLDIPLVINGSVVHNFEVDGLMGHSSEEELEHDFLRDRILLNEFGFQTTRITNTAVFEDVKAVADKVIEVVNLY